MSTAIEILERELASATSARDRSLATIEAEKVRVAEIEIQVRTLQKVLSQIGNSEDSENGDESRLPGATEALFDYLRVHPRSDRAAVIEAVASVVNTTSKDPKRLILNTILIQAKKGKVVCEGEDNKTISLAEDAPPRTVIFD